MLLSFILLSRFLSCCKALSSDFEVCGIAHHNQLPRFFFFFSLTEFSPPSAQLDVDLKFSESGEVCREIECREAEPHHRASSLCCGIGFPVCGGRIFS
jgi:hypothetical protein